MTTQSVYDHLSMSIAHGNGQKLECPVAMNTSPSLVSRTIHNILRRKKLIRAAVVSAVLGCVAYGVRDHMHSMQDARDQREADAVLQEREVRAVLLGTPKSPLQLSELKGKNLMKMLGEDIRIGSHIIRLIEANNDKRDIQFIINGVQYHLDESEKYRLTKDMALRVIDNGSGAYALESNFIGSLKIQMSEIERRLDTLRDQRYETVYQNQAKNAGETSPPRTYGIGIPYDYKKPLGTQWKEYWTSFRICETESSLNVQPSISLNYESNTPPPSLP